MTLVMMVVAFGVLIYALRTSSVEIPDAQNTITTLKKEGNILEVSTMNPKINYKSKELINLDLVQDIKFDKVSYDRWVVSFSPKQNNHILIFYINDSQQKLISQWNIVKK